MPFSTKKIEAAPTNVDVKEERQQIMDAIGAARAVHDKIEDKSAELTRVEAALAEVNNDLERNGRWARQLENEIVVLTTTRDMLAKETVKATEGLKVINTEVLSTAATLEAQRAKIEANTGVLTRLEASYQAVEKDRHAAVDRLHDIQGDITAIEYEKAAAQNDLEETKKVLASQKTVLLTESDTLKKDVVAAREAIELARRELDAAKAEREHVQNNNAKIIDAAEVIAAKTVADAQKKAEDIEKVLSDREGMIAKREAWQAEHQQRLLDFKLELEKLTNRKLPIQIEI